MRVNSSVGIASKSLKLSFNFSVTSESSLISLDFLRRSDLVKVFSLEFLTVSFVTVNEISSSTTATLFEKK